VDDAKPLQSGSTIGPRQRFTLRKLVYVQKTKLINGAQQHLLQDVRSAFKMFCLSPGCVSTRLGFDLSKHLLYDRSNGHRIA
jgi:hypothetical protein